jgi:hypothetical protein
VKRTAPILALSLAAACSGSDPASPLFGGFAVQDSTAVVFQPVVCDIPGVGTASVAGVALYFANYSSPIVCDVVAATGVTGYCGTRESSTAVLGLALQGELGAGGIAGATPGTFAYMANPPTGPFRAAAGSGAQVGPLCAAVSGGHADMTGGSITLTAIATDRVAGSVDMKLEGNQAFSQSFDVATCPVSMDLCQKLTWPCFDYTCVPAP